MNQSIKVEHLKARWILDVNELESLTEQWNQLVEASVWQNPTHSPAFLIPAFKHLNDCNARCMVIEDHSNSNQVRLCGLLPLVNQKIYGLPSKAIGLWKHDFCFDGTPLIHKQCVAEVIAETVRFLAAEKYSLLRLSPLVGGTEITQALNDTITRFKGSAFVVNAYDRAAFEPASDNTQYVTDNLSKKFRQKSQRLARRLAEEGEVVYEPTDTNSDFLALAEQFIDLEKAGWKGKNGTALGSKNESRSFYLDVIKRLSQSGQARFLTLKMNNKPIAMISTMNSGKSVQAFKTTFDESFSSFSPGVAIEIHNLELMHKDGISFADSCAATSESAMNRIWGQKVNVQNIVVPLRAGTPTALVKLLPLLQKLTHALTSNK